MASSLISLSSLAIILFVVIGYHEAESKVVVRIHHMGTRAPEPPPMAAKKMAAPKSKPKQHSTTHKPKPKQKTQKPKAKKKKNKEDKEEETTTEETTTQDTATTKDPLYKQDEKDFEDCAKKPFEDGAKNFQNSASAGFDPSKQAESYKQNYDEDSADAKKCYDKGQQDASNHATEDRA